MGEKEEGTRRRHVQRVYRRACRCESECERVMEVGTGKGRARVVQCGI